MSDVTRILMETSGGDPKAARQLLPLLYDQLRLLARQRLSRESGDCTLQPTALVHEAYVRLVGDADVAWESRGHFFAAAAESMRRILIELARRRRSEKHGGHFAKVSLSDVMPIASSVDLDQFLDLDEAISKLEEQEPELARLVALRYFAGLTVEQVAKATGKSPRTVKRNWSFARAWLGRELNVGG